MRPEFLSQLVAARLNPVHIIRFLDTFHFILKIVGDGANSISLITLIYITLNLRDDT